MLGTGMFVATGGDAAAAVPNKGTSCREWTRYLPMFQPIERACWSEPFQWERVDSCVESSRSIITLPDAARLTVLGSTVIVTWARWPLVNTGSRHPGSE